MIKDVHKSVNNMLKEDGDKTKSSEKADPRYVQLIRKWGITVGTMHNTS
jgi:hypothetical protein